MMVCGVVVQRLEPTPYKREMLVRLQPAPPKGGEHGSRRS